MGGGGEDSGEKMGIALSRHAQHRSESVRSLLWPWSLRRRFCRLECLDTVCLQVVNPTLSRSNGSSQKFHHHFWGSLGTTARHPGKTRPTMARSTSGDPIIRWDELLNISRRRSRAALLLLCMGTCAFASLVAAFFVAARRCWVIPCARHRHGAHHELFGLKIRAGDSSAGLVTSACALAFCAYGFRLFGILKEHQVRRYHLAKVFL